MREERRMSIEGILEQGFVTTKADQLINYMRTGSKIGRASWRERV